MYNTLIIHINDSCGGVVDHMTCRMIFTASMVNKLNMCPYMAKKGSYQYCIITIGYTCIYK